MRHEDEYRFLCYLGLCWRVGFILRTGSGTEYTERKKSEFYELVHINYVLVVNGKEAMVSMLLSASLCDNNQCYAVQTIVWKS